MGVAIVAIPSDRDPVWKYSSEKVPHMTLLFLGDQKDNPNLSQMIEYVSHVVSTVSPFMMMVENRGTLGPDNADVLFFRKDYLDSIPDLRKHLLDNENIKKAYESIDQFPNWTPHLTMGYPKTPAKKDDRDYPGFDWVNFDKIAVWTGDYSGPTFELKNPQLSSVEVAMTDDLTKFLEHYGIKGMHWGVRHDPGHVGERATNKKIAKLDKKFEKMTFGKTISIHNRAADLTNKNDVERINNKPEYKAAAERGDFLKDTPIRKKYYDEHMRAYLDNVQKAADEYGTNASGTKKYNILETGDGNWKIVVTDHGIKHSATDNVEMIVKVEYDDKGQIVGLMPDAAQHEDVIEEFLEHYGIKGMHWGVRKESVAPGETLVTQKKPGTKVVATGGKQVPAHPDAMKAAAAKQRAKASTTDALSNKELQDLVTRLNLEQQYSRLTSNQKGTISRGNARVKEILDAKNTVDRVLNDPAVKPHVNKLATDIFNAIRK